VVIGVEQQFPGERVSADLEVLQPDRVPWLLASDFPTEESSVRGYVNALLTAYNRAVERDAQRRGWLDRLFKRRS
jgi:hypothetical protein